MVQMRSPYRVKFREEAREAPLVDIPEGRVEHYLSRGWKVADEDYVSENALPVPEKVDLAVETPDVKADGVGYDTGAPLGVPDVVKTAPADLPGLSGKTKEVLEQIARDEGVEFGDDITKPDLKRAIETKRAENSDAAK